MVRHNPCIHGITVDNSKHKYAAYADDILFYIQQPQISFPNLMSAFSKFSVISNFKINMTKSEILNISVPRHIVAQLKQSFPFSWQKSKMKFLGIYLTPKLTSLFRTNFLTLLNTIRSDLQKWSQLVHFWLGRISFVKMNILPRLLFLFQMIPYGILAGFFTLIRSMIGRYVWNRRHPRLARALLVRPKRQRGLALLNIKQYFLAIIKNRITDWKYHKESKLWVNLEMSLSKADHFTQIWIPKNTELYPQILHCLRIRPLWYGTPCVRHINGNITPLSCR